MSLSEKRKNYSYGLNTYQFQKPNLHANTNVTETIIKARFTLKRIPQYNFVRVPIIIHTHVFMEEC